MRVPAHTDCGTLVWPSIAILGGRLFKGMSKRSHPMYAWKMIRLIRTY